jgi:Ca2+-binding EF-hand superfamily protein
LTKKGTGFITIEDLKKAFKEAAPTVSVGIIEQIFREVDTNHDGRVSFKDFEKLMKSNVQ